MSFLPLPPLIHPNPVYLSIQALALALSLSLAWNIPQSFTDCFMFESPFFPAVPPGSMGAGGDSYLVPGAAETVSHLSWPQIACQAPWLSPGVRPYASCHPSCKCLVYRKTPLIQRDKQIGHFRNQEEASGLYTPASLKSNLTVRLQERETIFKCQQSFRSHGQVDVLWIPWRKVRPATSR